MDPGSASAGPLSGANEEEEEGSIHSDRSLSEDTGWGGSAWCDGTRMGELYKRVLLEKEQLD